MEHLFAGAVALVLYVLFGYPLLLALRARYRRRPVVKRFEARTVSVLLPVSNGEAWIGQKLDNLLDLDYPEELLDIIVVSDGSTDGTERIANEFTVRHKSIKCFSIPKKGKAEALNRAIEEARGEILFFTDVRQAIEREALRSLVACFADPSVGVVSGELVIRDGQTHEEANVGLYWNYEKWIRKRLSAMDSVLGATGCLYAMRRHLAKPLPAGTLLDDVHLPMGAFFAGYRIVMEEQAKAYDQPTRLDREFRRKVRTQAGIYQLIAAFPALLWPGTRMWLDFVSYKLGRLALPWALVAVAVSSFWLPDGWRGIAILGQAVFYTAAGVDLWIPEGMLVKRVTGPARAFVVLIAAAAGAVAIVAFPPERLWRAEKSNGDTSSTDEP